MQLRSIYLVAAIIGTILPWWFFAGFIAEHGLDVPLFVNQLFANDPASGFTADILITVAIFAIWSFLDARTHDVRRWWVVIPACLLVGLSLALPLYLYLRSGAKDVGLAEAR